MDDPGGSTYFISMVCLLLSAFFSGSETAIFSSDEVRLKSTYPGNHRATKVLELKSDPEHFLSAVLFGNTLVNVVFSSTIALLAYSWFPSSKGFAEFVSTVLGTVLLLLFAEITPKFIAGSNPERVSVVVAPALTWLKTIMSPFSAAFVYFVEIFSRFVPEAEENSVDLTEARIMAALEYGRATGAIGSAEKEIIIKLIETRELVASEVMVPRPKVVAIEEQRSALEALNVMLEHGFSRIPVYSDSKDNITGIVNIKDLTVYIGEHPHDWAEALSGIPARDFAVPPYFIPESKKATDLLYEMRETGIHMVIVVDEFDGVSGLITLEDLIEEFVGEIEDEYDVSKTEFERIDERTWCVPGSMSLTDFKDLTGIEIATEECDSISGLVMMCLDRVPVPGDAFCLVEPKVCFTVKEVSGPRITKVICELAEEGEDQ